MKDLTRRTLRVCLVCTGNTCRSPMSEGILKALASERGLAHWEVCSFGLQAFEGAPATPHAVTVAREHDIDISGHRARLLEPSEALHCDVILVHSGEHFHRVLSWGDVFEKKTFLLKLFPHSGDAGPEAWVADPIGQDLDAYRRTFMELDEVLRRIVPQIEKWAGTRG